MMFGNFSCLYTFLKFLLRAIWDTCRASHTQVLFSSMNIAGFGSLVYAKIHMKQEEEGGEEKKEISVISRHTDTETAPNQMCTLR